MGAVKKAFDSVTDLFGGTIVGGLAGVGQDVPEPDNTAARLQEEEEAKRRAQQQAQADLNPTGTLGAGTPTTTRRNVLGV